MFEAEGEPPLRKRMVPQRFSPGSCRGVTALQRGRDIERTIRLRAERKSIAAACAVRLRHGFSPECSSSRHIFLKNAACAKVILRFELSHKSGSNFFQNSTDFLDKERRAAYVLEHRMRTACVCFGPSLTHPFFSVSANQRECVMYDINCIASVRVACSCRETIKGKVHTALRRM